MDRSSWSVRGSRSSTSRRFPLAWAMTRWNRASRLRLVVALRRLGLPPVEAGRLAALCIDRGQVDLDLAPLIASQRAAIERQRADLDRVDAELTDLELTIAAAGRARRSLEESMSAAPIRVLFVCTGNSARSQIAEALLRDFGGADFETFSAGTEPKGVNPFAVRVLDEIGIDWSGASSKSVMDFVGQPFDYVITVCDRARQTCPVFPGEHNSLHWGLDDPAEVHVAVVGPADRFQEQILVIRPPAASIDHLVGCSLVGNLASSADL